MHSQIVNPLLTANERLVRSLQKQSTLPDAYFRGSMSTFLGRNAQDLTSYRESATNYHMHPTIRRSDTARLSPTMTKFPPHSWAIVRQVCEVIAEAIDAQRPSSRRGSEGRADVPGGLLTGSLRPLSN